MSRPPEIPGATYVGNDKCRSCHGDIVRQFPDSPHARFHREGQTGPEATGCESCHGPGSLHVEAGGGRGRHIFNPRRDPASCMNCHLQVHADFRLPQHHPVWDGTMGCTDCHDPHGRDIMKPAGGGGLAMARWNESCVRCHRDQTRPFVFEHEAMREGCVTCHQPHGSFNRKLLVERDSNLCLKCHAQEPGPGGEILIGKVPHRFQLQRGTCWTAGCHTAVHGSNVHPRLMY